MSFLSFSFVDDAFVVFLFFSSSSSFSESVKFVWIFRWDN